ncbi:hypothetical protein J4232_05975 [Candidatus Woesearchaeota archaeon]|nr:hypothetical protein [Candidatus Woesearchaeota archaeon]
MQLINRNMIILNKEINELDKFVLEFVDIIKKYTNYIIISGYVAILLGRTRGTDDIDMIIPIISFESFSLLYKELLEKGFWSLNSSKATDLYELLLHRSSVRFAMEPLISPNMEIKFSKNMYDQISLKSPVIIKLGEYELKTSQLELQIAYKEEVLKSNKDMEDAKHIRLIGKQILDESLIRQYKQQLRDFDG